MQPVCVRTPRRPPPAYTHPVYPDPLPSPIFLPFFLCPSPRFCPCSLLNSEGSLVSFAGETDRAARMIAAIAANIWTTYDKDAKNALDCNDAELMLIQNEVGVRVRADALALAGFP